MNKSLIECLDTLSIEEIDNLYLQYANKKNEKKVSLDDKKQLLHKEILQMFSTVCIAFSSEEDKQLKNIIDGKNVSKVSSRLVDSAFVFKIDNKYIVPKDFVEVFNTVISPEVKMSKEIIVISFYIQANGAIHIDKLYELVKNTGIDTTKKRISEYVLECDYLLEDDVVYENVLAKELNVYELNKNNEYREYELDEIFLLKIMDAEKDEDKKISKILSKYTKNKIEMANTIVNMIRMGYDCEDKIKSYLTKENVILNQKDQEKFDSLVIEKYLRTPSWEFNGFIPAEILNNGPDNYMDMTKMEYIHAYMLINGVIDINRLLELFEKEHNIKMTKEELENMINAMEDLSIMNNHIVVTGVTPEILKKLKMVKGLKSDYKVIDNINAIFDEDNENVLKIKNICQQYKLKDEIINAFISAMNFGGFNPVLLEAILDSFKVKLDEKKKSEVLKKLEDVSKNVRVWSLNGYKMNEVSKSEVGHSQKSNKIGRNEKCVCGSGKKYKHCCGR